MNGIIAAAFWASSLMNPHMPLSEGWDIRPSLGRQSTNFSIVQFQKENVGTEVGYSYISPVAFGPLQPIYALSVTDQKGTWIGGGFSNNFMLSDKEFLSLSFLPGVYIKGEDENLGGWLMFRSGIELGTYISSRWVVSVSYDHRSSGDLWAYNPGLETIQFRIGRLL